MVHDALRARRHPAHVLARARVQPAPPAAGRAARPPASRRSRPALMIVARLLSAARLFGWTPLESVFAGAIVAISSTTIIVKAFAEQAGRGAGARARLRRPDRRGPDRDPAPRRAHRAPPVATGSRPRELGWSRPGGSRRSWSGCWRSACWSCRASSATSSASAARRPRWSPASASASAARSWPASLGYSVALGAFIAGSLVAESGAGEVIERLVEPVRDMFAAIFFVAVGMLIDPVLVARALARRSLVAHRWSSSSARSSGVSLGAFLTGQGRAHLGADRA